MSISALKILVNGEPVEQIAALDRGFLYGQSVFETVAVSNGKRHLEKLHLQRLAKGCNTLSIPYPEQLSAEIDMLCQSTDSSGIAKTNGATDNCVLRITLSMGQGGRGYRNPAQPLVNRVLSLHEYPQYPQSYLRDGIECGVAHIRLAHQPALAGLKHGNRLEQIIACSEWPCDQDGQSHWQEALMLDHADNVIEGTKSNLFILNGDQLSTPKLDQAGVAGVMRETILSMAESLGITTQIVSLSLSDVEQADAAFFSNSLVGVWPIRRLKNTHYNDLSFAHKLMKILVKNESIPTF